MIAEEIRERLFALRDEEYKALQCRLIPSVSPQSFIGVRTPALRRLAKDLGKREDIRLFLDDLPHAYFDENQLHAFILSGFGDYGRCMEELNRFLPHVDNWATCDQMSPGVFRAHRPELLDQIRIWIRSGRPYTVRFGIGMLMQHFLDEDFDPACPELAAGVRSDEYYVSMMIAWYFATALAKQYDAALPFIREKKLDPWVHNKAIQKALESFRIAPERKALLRGMKIKARGNRA